LFDLLYAIVGEIKMIVCVWLL